MMYYENYGFETFEDVLIDLIGMKVMPDYKINACQNNNDNVHINLDVVDENEQKHNVEFNYNKRVYEDLYNIEIQFAKDIDNCINYVYANELYMRNQIG